ncbi:Na+ transporter [Striga asiatica]|uniref:Na+ transporter n=1 Tax=Striga asiatica TaxID=4170 RepID=A0A5A7PVK6_STRAF|nr:Na+ transporter [Striga asiatica]
MNSLTWYGKKLQHLCTKSWNLAKLFIHSHYRDILFKVNPFFIYLFYFISLPFLGFGVLKSLNPRSPNFAPRDIDLLFTSVSAATVSSMSTVEMEVFSDSQLIFMTVLMFVGGEVFTSMLGLHLRRLKNVETWKGEEKIGPVSFISSEEIEMGSISRPGSRPDGENPFIEYDSINFLGFVVWGYLLVFHILGVFSVLVYLSLIRSARGVLRRKGLKILTFAVFTTVSSFSNCGFVPTNENMIVFGKNSGLLLILIPQILFGNTLFPPGLRLAVWAVGKRFKKAEARYLLHNENEARYTHFLPRAHIPFLVGTVFGFILIGFVLLCAMEWDSIGLSGLGSYQKVVGVIFLCVNARHAGETIVDLSTIAPAILAFFVVMMYLPPYASFVPIKRDDQIHEDSKLGRKEIKRTRIAENILFSQLSYLAIFIIIICITERKSLKNDPMNFSVLNIIVEVISAYGNVGFTTGYSCDRLIRPHRNCVNKWYGFSGKWSDEGKIVLIVVMIFGRLKKFNMNGGQAWKLL